MLLSCDHCSSLLPCSCLCSNMMKPARWLSMSCVCAVAVIVVVYQDFWLSSQTLKKGVSFNHTITKLVPTGQPRSTSLFYNHNRDVFIDEFTKCLLDRDYCKVLYWHIQKTGGTYIASQMHPLFNREPYRSKEWCCNNDFMKARFRPHIKELCSKRFGVYEVRSKEYHEVLRTCQDFQNQMLHNSSATSNRHHRYIGFVSIREPIQRSLSAIHQICNVHQSGLRQQVRQTCERCSYDIDDDKPFFEKYVNQTNNFYTGLMDILVSESLSVLGIPIYVVDNQHIRDMFQQLETSIDNDLKKKGSNMTFRFPAGTKNSEAASKLCDFGMTSSLMKQHQEALDAYHRIWSKEPSRRP